MADFTDKEGFSIPNQESKAAEKKLLVEDYIEELSEESHFVEGSMMRIDDQDWCAYQSRETDGAITSHRIRYSQGIENYTNDKKVESQVQVDIYDGNHVFIEKADEQGTNSLSRTEISFYPGSDDKEISVEIFKDSNHCRPHYNGDQLTYLTVYLPTLVIDTSNQTAADEAMDGLGEEFDGLLKASITDTFIDIDADMLERLQTTDREFDWDLGMAKVKLHFDQDKRAIVIDSLQHGEEKDEDTGEQVIKSKDNIFVPVNISYREAVKVLLPDPHVVDEPMMKDPSNEIWLERSNLVREAFGLVWKHQYGGGQVKKAMKALDDESRSQEEY